MRHCAVGLSLAIVMLTGCTSPRLVEVSQNGGCVAIADNSDSWPSYNRTKAMELMSKQCPNGYKIVQEKEVVVGQTRTNSVQRDTKEVPIVKGLVADVQETTQHTTEVHDRTEWRIWFQKN